jgi:hypothetical protein
MADARVMPALGWSCHQQSRNGIEERKRPPLVFSRSKTDEKIEENFASPVSGM